MTAATAADPFEPPTEPGPARATVLRGRTPELFERMTHRAVGLVEKRPWDDRIVFLKSWNEWAEGNYIEPDLQWGRAFLEALDRATALAPIP